MLPRIGGTCHYHGRRQDSFTRNASINLFLDEVERRVLVSCISIIPEVLCESFVTESRVHRISNRRESGYRSEVFSVAKGNG
jgi:hypothetical protein